MSLLQELAQSLARDTFRQAAEAQDPTLIDDVAEAIGASSTTLQEEYLTAIRFLRAEARARQLLAQRARPRRTVNKPDASR
jgi:chromosomal replication initiation ATPase DnaA